MKKIQEIISKRPFAVIGGTLILGLLLGWLLFGGNGSAAGSGEKVAAEHSASEHVTGTTWTCSMHPQIRNDEPGRCPICGMDLIPLINDVDDEVNADAVVLSASAMKIAEVETSVIEKTAAF